MIDQVYNAAGKWLASRVNVRTELNSREISERLPPSVRAHSFFSARVGEARIVEGLRAVSDQYSQGKINLAAARQMLREFVSKDGRYDPQNPSITNLASRARAELILDQNRRMAAAVAEYEAGIDPDIIDRFPYWRYHARGDERTRSSHAAYDGKVFRKTDPIWRRIFPPWEFRCRCWVEELTEEEAGDLGGAVTMSTPPVPESGYEFDPAHAFEQYDLSELSGPEFRAVQEDAEAEFGSQVKFADGSAKITQKDFHTFEDEGLDSAKKWSLAKLPPIPPAMQAEEARRKLERGISIESADKRKLHFGEAVLSHWSARDGKLPKDVAARLRHLNTAMETVKHPLEVWDQGNQTAYIQVFGKTSGAPAPFFVYVVEENGEVITFFRKDLSAVDKARKGFGVKRYGDESST